MEQFIVLADPFVQMAKWQVRSSFTKVLEAIHRTTKRTTHIVFLSAFIAFILNDIFRLLSYRQELLLHYVT